MLQYTDPLKIPRRPPINACQVRIVTNVAMLAVVNPIIILSNGTIPAIPAINPINTTLVQFGTWHALIESAWYF